MVDRRTILRIGATSLTGGLVGVPGLVGSATSARTHNVFLRAVFDGQFSECRAFAAEMNSVGVLASAVHGDVAGLWYNDLRIHLRKNRVPVAGLTDRAALFCLEELARDVNMRVIVRVDHLMNATSDRNGRVQHAVVGSPSFVAAARSLTTEPEFGRSMARLLSRLDMTERYDTAAQKLTGPFSLKNATSLVSWVIA